MIERKRNKDFGDIVGLVWVQFCWVFVGHLWVLFWRGGWWVMGNEAGVVCLSFVAFLDNGAGGGTGSFNGRKTKEEVKIRERREMGENRYGFGIYYFIV